MHRLFSLFSNSRYHTLKNSYNPSHNILTLVDNLA